MNKELEALEVIKEASIELQSMYEENMDCLGYHLNGETEPLNNFLENIGDLREVYDILKQALTPPNLEELEKSIIKRLNELYKVPERYNGFYYNKHKKVFEYFSAEYGYTNTDGYIYIDGLPLDLAHDITLYFKLRSNNE